MPDITDAELVALKHELAEALSRISDLEHALVLDVQEAIEHSLIIQDEVAPNELDDRRHATLMKIQHYLVWVVIHRSFRGGEKAISRLNDNLRKFGAPKVVMARIKVLDSFIRQCGPGVQAQINLYIKDHI
jgi:hypothetical protein